jgi:hypothetical protein
MVSDDVLGWGDGHWSIRVRCPMVMRKRGRCLAQRSKSRLENSKSGGIGMRRYFACCIAVVVIFTVLAAANAEDDGKWEPEQRRSFIFTLSYKQST